MVIKVIPEKEELMESRWFSLLFGLAIIFLLISLAAYLFLLYTTSKAQERVQALNQALATEISEGQRALERRVLATQQKVNDLPPLLDDHRRPSSLLLFLEEFSHPQVLLANLNLDTRRGRLTLKGRAESFLALSQQQTLWQKTPFVNEVRIDELSLSEEGGVKFNLSLYLKADIFTPSSSDEGKLEESEEAEPGSLEQGQLY